MLLQSIICLAICSASTQEFFEVPNVYRFIAENSHICKYRFVTKNKFYIVHLTFNVVAYNASKTDMMNAYDK